MWWFHFQLSACTEPGARLAQVGNVTWYCHFNSFLQGQLNGATCVLCVYEQVGKGQSDGALFLILQPEWRGCADIAGKLYFSACEVDPAESSQSSV